MQRDLKFPIGTILREILSIDTDPILKSSFRGPPQCLTYFYSYLRVGNGQGIPKIPLPLPIPGVCTNDY